MHACINVLRGNFVIGRQCVTGLFVSYIMLLPCLLPLMTNLKCDFHIRRALVCLLRNSFGRPVAATGETLHLSPSTTPHLIVWHRCQISQCGNTVTSSMPPASSVVPLHLWSCSFPLLAASVQCSANSLPEAQLSILNASLYITH